MVVLTFNVQLSFNKELCYDCPNLQPLKLEGTFEFVQASLPKNTQNPPVHPPSHRKIQSQLPIDAHTRSGAHRKKSALLFLEESLYPGPAASFFSGSLCGGAPKLHPILDANLNASFSEYPTVLLMGIWVVFSSPRSPQGYVCPELHSVSSAL